MKLFDRDMTKVELTQRVGHLSQVFGVQRCTLREGSAEGVEVLEVATGGGLRFQVLPGRGMDLGRLEYRGVPFAFIGKGGVAHPHLYDPRGWGWLKTFGGGFLVTCGLTHAGIPEEDEGEELGLHGRVSHLQAEEIHSSTTWEGDEATIRVSGKVRESSLHHENLLLTRSITAQGGSRSFKIIDIVTNEGFAPTPLMFLYHFNLGFPLISGDSRFIAPITKTEPWEATPEAAGLLDRCCDLLDPIPGREDVLFFHEVALDSRGNTCIAVVNKRLQLGIQLSYSKSELPLLSQANILKSQDYFLALEPGNCTPAGRVNLRDKGQLRILDPQEEVRFSITIEVLDGAEEIQALESRVAALLSER
ncbi:MAG: DUF4432 family protein [Spirochaetaceae bacterium]|nr:MAG: DUF4432 family protein [Spirochaetaceae bacterium]